MTVLCTDVQSFNREGLPCKVAHDENNDDDDSDDDESDKLD